MRETRTQGRVQQQRRSRAEAEQLVDVFEASGLRRREFCQQHGVAVGTLDLWRKRRRQERGTVAGQHNGVRRVLARWMRYDVIALDEVGYVPLAEIGAEFLFQVIAERAERATLIVTTNLPFSEWTQVFPNPRLCKALLERVTDRAHIIETGTESYRFRRTLEVRQKKKAS